MLRLLARSLSSLADRVHRLAGGVSKSVYLPAGYGPLLVEIGQEVERQRRIYPGLPRLAAEAIDLEGWERHLRTVREIAETWVEIARGDAARAREEGVQALAFLARVVVGLPTLAAVPRESGG